MLLLGVAGGIQGIGTKLLQKDEFVPLGDRVAATLLGGALLGLAALRDVGIKRTAFWITLAIGALVVLGYAAFLSFRFWADSKKRAPTSARR